LAPLLSHIFRINFFAREVSHAVEARGCVTVYKTGNGALITNYRLIAILIHFSTILESVIYNQFSFYFKLKLYQSKHVFIKAKSAAANLITCLNSITFSVSSQGQTDSVYFDISQVFDGDPHAFSLHKLSNFGLSDGHINWFQIYSSPRFSVVRTLRNCSAPFEMLSGVPQGSTVGPHCSTCL
jgi:hypothetical protein